MSYIVDSSYVTHYENKNLYRGGMPFKKYVKDMHLQGYILDQVIIENVLFYKNSS